LVIGLGTIGLLVTMLLAEAGIRNILVIGNKEFQKQKATEIGIPKDNYCDSRYHDMTGWVREHTGGLGADIIFECVGKNETYCQAVDCAGISGNIILVGNPCSDMSLNKEIYWKILRNELTIKGTWNSSFTPPLTEKLQEDKSPIGPQADTLPPTEENIDDWHYVLNRLAAKKIQPEHIISHHFSLEQLETGLHIMRDKSEDYGKIMITTS
ncbi:MAG: zinc-binding dehydrogenase, partial [Lachnospiraceae bacterium]|nr:zinc-binding dehydrogenase [Lachnospiraceae bacterium]